MLETVRLRVSGREKRWIQTAADIQGVTVSDFIRAAANRSAANVFCQRMPQQPIPSWDSGESLPMTGPTPDDLDAAIAAHARTEFESSGN